MAGFWQKLGIGRKEYEKKELAGLEEVTASNGVSYGHQFASIATLYGNEFQAPRTRLAIYDKWSSMEAGPVIPPAISALCTNALGGHETTGDVIFIETKAEFVEDKQIDDMVNEINQTITPILNKIAFQICYNACVFGDAYARVYADKERGVIALDSSEFYRAPMVTAFERGEKTIGYLVATGKSMEARLSALQMARMKMPRRQWVPQHGTSEKFIKLQVTEDDIEQLPVLPSSVGGSLLYTSEMHHDNLVASLLGLVNQRWKGSIDEQIVTANTDSMTDVDQQRFLQSVEAMLRKSKTLAEDSVKRGRPILERVRHLIPVFNDKQLVQVLPMNSDAQNGNITIDDVMVHARLLAGSLGVDLSMLGFADQLSGGLGEGGGFIMRTSVQVAENSRGIRSAFSDFVNHVLTIHTMARYGVAFERKPWDINFYSANTAQEAEAQKSRMDSATAGGLILQAIQQMKELGFDKRAASEFLQKTLRLDDDLADLYASQLENAKPDEGGM